MQETKEVRIDDQVMWHNSDVLPKVRLQFFDPDWLRSSGNMSGSALGRDSVYFFHFEELQFVLRHFQRGGLIGAINKDRYFRLGDRSSRAYREYCLLGWMSGQGLLVPRPVAARYAPSGLFYRADLITERIPGARPLAEVLQETAVPPDVWSEIGATVRRMHALAVYHADLNCRNILLDEMMQVWLIDFDKCRRRKAGAWTRRNLARLNRSLQKEHSKHPGLHWTESDWSALMAGYSRG